MVQDELVEILGVKFPCVDKGFGNNVPVDVVIRPEDIQIKTRNKGKLNGHVISSLFKGVYYDILVETKRGASKKITLHVLSDKDVNNIETKERITEDVFYTMERYSWQTESIALNILMILARRDMFTAGVWITMT